MYSLTSRIPRTQHEHGKTEIDEIRQRAPEFRFGHCGTPDRHCLGCAQTVDWIWIVFGLCSFVPVHSQGHTIIIEINK